MKKVVLALTLLSLLLNGCRKDSAESPLDTQLREALELAAKGGGLEFFTMPESNDFSKIPQDPKNPITKDKVDLGRFLFHETGLGVNPIKAIGKGTYSCASCHFASAGFQSGRFQGIGEGGVGIGQNGSSRNIGPLYTEADVDVQPIRTPSAMNMAYQTNILWNGQFGATGVNSGLDYAFTPGTPKETNNLGYEGLETQAIAGQKVHHLDMRPGLADSLGYKTMFDVAFPDFPVEKRYTRETAGLAIAAYERSLLANKAPFQQWLKGNTNAMSEKEKRGAILFFDKAECVACHTGPALSKMEFYGLGMKDIFECPEKVFKVKADQPEHLGRGGFTGREEDKYKFKVPQLYNLADSPFYGHGSTFRTISEVVEYKNRGVKENSSVSDTQLALQFIPLGLTKTEIEDLTTFLKHALHDNDLKRYEPESLKSGQCFPNNDPMSKVQLGCN